MSALTRIATALVLGSAALAGCDRGVPVERPPMASQQTGFRGTGMVQIDNPRIKAPVVAKQTFPEPLPAVPDEGPAAREIYQNLKVLGDLKVGEFTRTMLALTAWVAPPAEGCNYCHNPQNLAEDSKYTKVVARRMIEMTQTVNAKWGKHHNGTGVTCWTCHRGQTLPANMWFTAPPNLRSVRLLGDDAGQNIAAGTVGWTSLPYDPFTPFLAGTKADPDVRVYSSTALPTGNRHSIKQAEFTYGLMMHMSGALGVNCTFCHNTNSFASWDGPVQRVNAWYGIRMVGELNAQFITPLTGAVPKSRLGPTGDIGKISCATCHQGVNKPVNGAKMAQHYPALMPAAAASAPAAAMAASAPAAPAAPAKTAAAPAAQVLAAAR